LPINSRNGSLFEGDEMGVLLEFIRVKPSVSKGRVGKAAKHFEPRNKEERN